MEQWMARGMGEYMQGAQSGEDTRNYSVALLDMYGST